MKELLITKEMLMNPLVEPELVNVLVEILRVLNVGEITLITKENRNYIISVERDLEFSFTGYFLKIRNMKTDKYRILDLLHEKITL